MSSTSFMDDVEMAHDEVFGGPMAESVPTSLSSFAHRGGRGRADSTASFTYYQDDEDENLPSTSEDDSAILDEESALDYSQDDSTDLEAGDMDDIRRTSSAYSRASVHDHLLRRDSGRTEGSNFDRGHRTSQKIYVVMEDLTIVVAGFRTSTLGGVLYAMICVLTLGLGWLLLRWLPRLHVRLVGKPSPLGECSWVVIEVRSRTFLGLFLVSGETHVWVAILYSIFYLIYSIISSTSTNIFAYRTNGESLWSKTLTPKSMVTHYPPSLVFLRRSIFHMTRMMTRFWRTFVSLTIDTCDFHSTRSRTSSCFATAGKTQTGPMSSPFGLELTEMRKRNVSEFLGKT
jgi:hypothetical protein